MADAYQPQLNPAGSSDYSGAPSGGLGQPIAQALEYGGELMDQEIHRRKELNRDMEATTAGVQLAKASAAIDKAAIDARANAGPAGAGHSATVNQMVDDQAGAALGSIKDPHVRQVFTQRWADLKGQIGTREYGWEAGQRVNYLTTNVQQATDVYARQQAANPDLHALPNQLSSIHDTIYSTAGIDDDTKAKLTKEQQRAVVMAHAQAAIDQDPTDVVGDEKSGKPSLLAEPAFNQYLNPEDIKTLRDAADVELRRQAAEQRQQLAQDKAAAVTNIDLLGKEVTDLHKWDLPDSAFEEATAQAKKFGLEDRVIDIADWRDLRDTNRQYRTANPATIQNDTNALATKVTDGSATDAERLRYKHLQQIGPDLISQFNADPDAAAARMNNPRPQLDWSQATPGQVAANVSWARSFAAANGMVDPPYLPNAIKKDLTDRMKQGPAAKLQVAQQLRGWFQGAIGSQVANQLAPGDSGFKLMVGFDPRVAQLYEHGGAAIDSKTAHLGSTQDATAAADDRNSMNTAFAAYAQAVPTDLVPALKDAADKVAAGMALEYRIPELTGDQLNTAYAAALQRVGGRTGKVNDWNAPGGFMQYNGRWAWLPPTVSTNQAITRLSRAGRADWVKAGGGDLYSLGGDGKPVPLTDSQVSQLGKYKLDLYVDPQTNVAVPGIYTLINPATGGHLIQKDGRTPWHFDIRNLR